MQSRFRPLLILALPIAVALLVASPALAAPEQEQPPGQTTIDYPTDMPPIAVSVVRDGLDAQGHWVQTVRLTIRPGGTLSDASLVVFGDVTHVDTLFKAAQRANPHLSNPAMIPIGQQIDLPIDPSTTFVLGVVLHGSNTVVQRFTNGAVNTIYTKPNGSVTRMLTFPARKLTEFFAFPGLQGPIKVRPGGRLVDIRFAQGETFAEVVQQTYGLTTYGAAVDLARQTGWSPVHWPPPTGEIRRVITEPPAVYEATPPEATLIPNPDPIGRARQVALHQQRLRAGIYAVRQESFGTVYHVAVTDPSVTSSKLSNLIYGNPSHRLDIARAAGYQIPAGANSQSAGFDPHLLGRSFDLTVGYQDENFVVWRKMTSNGVQSVSLVDGAQVITYPTTAHGLLEMVKYPTQYKRIIYRPSKLSLTLAQGLALFHVASDPDLSSSTANALARDYAARVLWQWSPGMPREPGDIADSVELIDEPAGPVIQVLVGPPVPRTAISDLADRLGLRNPLIVILSVVVVSTIVVLAVDLARRYAHRPRDLGW